MAFEQYTWLIYKDGATYKAKNGTTGVITYSNTLFPTVMQSIIDAIGTRDSAAFTKIKLAPGVYTVNTEIAINDKYNIHIEGSGNGLSVIRVGTTLGATANVFEIKGAVSGTARNLTANGTIRQRNVTMSTGDSANFAAGDMVLLRSTKAWWSGDTFKTGRDKRG